ncbi:MAG: GNAT family N-acetyltransferase [Planctomycetota bacterium]|jgi:CelD/BcsL family acetyltransferase involved in cellulose biosynthesis
MRKISKDELAADADAFDAAALATAGIDRFCSTSDWGFAAHEAWDPDLEPWLREGDAGYAAFLVDQIDDRRLLTPFDRMWGYSCPLIGGDATALATEFREALRDESDLWDLAIVTGLRESAPLWTALVATLCSDYSLGIGRSQFRWQASLEGGLDGYLSRRPRKLRRDLHRIERRARERDVGFERGAGDASALYARILDVEERSWKRAARTGLHHAEMKSFYAALVPRLLKRNRLRLLFATYEDRDVGYILGGVVGDIYRGLQFSFDDSLRDLGLGNLLQYVELRSLAEEGIAVYDLGIDIDYKSRWADEKVETSTLIIGSRP